jgi:endonuclease YncB( thermonuclease family)
MNFLWHKLFSRRQAACVSSKGVGMSRPYQILMPLLSLFFCRVDLTDLFPLTYKVELIRLLDADTALVKRGPQLLKVRFSKIDAPEKGQPFLRSRKDAGLAALRCAQKIIGHKKTFTLKIWGQDKYGRILGELDQLSFQFIEAGCVSLYPYASFESRSEKFNFIKAYLQAKSERRGLWSEGGYQQPRIWRQRTKRRAARPRLHR